MKFLKLFIVSLLLVTSILWTESAGAPPRGGPTSRTPAMSIAIDATRNVFVGDGGGIRKITPAGTVSVIAGAGRGGFGGDGGPATAATFTLIKGVAADATGNIYVSDHNRIRKINVAGIVSTLAGGETAGFGGDGGQATSAQFNDPTAVAVDASGNVYIADRGNHRIRKIASSGVVSSVAGTGMAGFGGDGGPAVTAQLNKPQGVVVDASGNLFVADSNNHRIRKIAPNGTISTFAGTGGGFGLGEDRFGGDGGPAISALLNNPGGVAIDSIGNVFISDTDNNRVRRVATSGTILTVAGMPNTVEISGRGARSFGGDDGPATSARLGTSWAVCVDASGNIFIADWGNGRVRKVTPAGIISTIASLGIRGNTSLAEVRR